MTTETQAAPVAEAQNTATESTTNPPAHVEPVSTDAEGQQANADEPKPEKSAEARELERLRRALTKRDRTQGKLYQENQTLREQLERLTPQQQAEAAATAERTSQDPVEIAKQMVKLEKVTERANTVAADGNKRFPDFGEALGTLRSEAGELFDRRGQPTPLGEAILESDDAAGLIHHLGQHPELAEELEGLSPAALGRKVARIEAQMAAAPAPKPVSKASDPIAPIRGTAGATVKAPDQMSQAEYEAHRKQQGARWAR